MERKMAESSQGERESPLERFMRAMFTHLLTAMARNLRNENMSVAQLAALHLLDRHKTLRVNELADALALPMSGASRLASDMVKRGLFERREDALDRRAKVLSLSLAGQDLIGVLSRQRVEEGARALGSIDGEVSGMMSVLLSKMTEQGLAHTYADEDAERKARGPKQ
jgi:DNA-binding MarR family transcriptional regulator